MLRCRIEATRGRISQTVNSRLVFLYWQDGKRLREEVLGDERAAYGEQTPGCFSLGDGRMSCFWIFPCPVGPVLSCCLAWAPRHKWFL